MGSFASLSGHRLTRAQVHWPPVGAWWAEVELDDAAALAGSVSLVVGDLTLAGTVRRGGSYKGQARYLLDGGGGGWRHVSLPSKSYRSDSGVRARTVLQDAATEAGETLDTTTLTDDVLGESYVRRTGPAERVLSDVVGAGGWYVAATGETALAARSGGAVDVSAFELLDFEPRLRQVELATESPAALEPGKTIEIDSVVETLGELRLELDPDRFRVRAWLESAGREARLRRVLRQLVREEIATAGLRGLYRYRVSAVSGGQIDLAVVDPTLGIPDLARVSQRCGLGGATVTPDPGAMVLVGFADGDPAHPFVGFFERPGEDGFVPAKVELDADAIDLGAADGVVIREGDKVNVGTQTGPITILPPYLGGAKSKVSA